MFTTRVIIPVLIGLVLLFCTAPALGEIPPGGTGWIAFKTNVPGATVYINGAYEGTTDSSGEFDILYDSSYTTYSIEKDLYYDQSGSIEMTPGADNVEISVTLTEKPTGSGKGYYTVHCDVNGASVAFNGQTSGTISNGVYTKEVSTTGTTYTTYSVTKSGYYTYSGSITSQPGDGETIDLYATLNPVTTAPTTAQETIGGSTAYYTIHCSVNGASVYFDNTYKGLISNGVLTVTVYTTGTPYSQYSVSASGYATATGSLPTLSSAGQTQNVYVTLTPVTATTVVTAAPVGSGMGTYAVYCNVDGAKVYFDNTYQGTISNGVLYDTVSVTGTPFSIYRIDADGYTSKSGSITQYPAAGEIVTFTVTLAKSPATTVPTTVPTTKAPLPLMITVAGILWAVALVIGRKN
ncbi:MAG: hypothetical protein LUQ31_05275 [Methanoregula sp.]|nr:hypothetical protein [Methanoregula sp.]